MKDDKLIAAFNRRFSRRRQERMFTGLLGALIALVFCRACAGEPKTIIVEVTPQPATEITVSSEETPSDDVYLIARVLYGLRDYHLSEAAKTAVVEVILNRVDDTAREFRTYNTIEAVCNQPEQWQGYNKDGSYLAEDLEIVKNRLADHSGARTIPEGCFFLKVTNGKVTVRTEWNGGNQWSVT